jgi:hypothetical protein
MSRNKYTGRRKGKLHIRFINLPQDSLLVSQVQAVMERIHASRSSRYRMQTKMQAGCLKTAQLILEGLYQVYGCGDDQMSLSVPTSQHGYGLKAYQIQGHTYTSVTQVLTALESLGWIKRKPGFKNKEEECIPTAIWLTDSLRDLFEGLRYVWRPMGPSQQAVIVLKGYDPITKANEIMHFKDNNTIRASRKKLQAVNQLLAQQAICLAIENWDLDHLRQRMSQKTYRLDWDYSEVGTKPRSLNFLHTQMRRIFARGSFTMGGRYYGAWWQYIPSEYRPYLTINGRPTVEVDYSELHPRLMYWEQGVEPPEGDLYDLGLRYPENPIYDKTKEPYQSKRKVIKAYINALINDEKGQFHLDHKQIKAIGMNTRRLRELVFQKHPILKAIAGTGAGLRYQYYDSQMAEEVLEELLAQGVVCLPIHDSFICSTQYEAQLSAAMIAAYERLCGVEPRLKDTQEPQTQLEPIYYPSGELNLQAMSAKSESLVHRIFVDSWTAKTAHHSTLPLPLCAQNVQDMNNNINEINHLELNTSKVARLKLP